MSVIKFFGLFTVFTIALAATVPFEDNNELLFEDTYENNTFILDPYDPTSDNNATYGFKACRKTDGTAGLCVPYTYCDKSTKTILLGGYIDTDARELHDNTCESPGSIDWCCDKREEPQAIETARALDPCRPLDSDICTWCVTLHKARDSTIMDVEAFCAGALIGSKVILTAATCLIAAKQLTLFAQVPASPDKTRNYVADKQELNPYYNSGTHSSDFGIIVLKEEVNWGSMAASGACINPVKIGGNCMTFGLDIADNFVSTFIDVSDGRCENMGGEDSHEVFCGKSKENECFAVTGAPVVCDNGNNGLVLVGVSRSGCHDGNIALGSYSESKVWIKTVFNSMKVNSIVYTT